MLYTACKNRPQHHKGLVLDVTVMSARPEDRCFAPTWELVKGAKSGALTWEQYTEGYLALLRARYALGPDKRPLDSAARARMLQVARLASTGDVTLTCYCGDPARCHRSLLADVLVKIGRAQTPPLAIRVAPLA